MVQLKSSMKHFIVFISYSDTYFISQGQNEFMIQFIFSAFLLWLSIAALLKESTGGPNVPRTDVATYYIFC